MKYLLISVLSILLIISGCKKETSTVAQQNKTIEDYLVKNNEISGWSFTANKWVIKDIGKLTEVIDGEADIYKKYGFVETAYQEYQGTTNNQQTTIKLFIYNQGSKDNAANLFNDPDAGYSGAISWTGAGEAAHYLRNGGLSQQLALRRGQYYVKLEILVDTQESLNILYQFAINVDGKLK